ncbi:zinc ribbon-containing protein [Acinetobacter wanghuae]|uniref:zinc ribbon-containing protein n=1 Tax=Acinetobacter wanghuae TaxID=2662362 RepID=UPI003AF58F6F
MPQSHNKKVNLSYRRLVYTRSTISKTTWRTKMVIAGSKPGTGFYFCIQCGRRAYLEIGTDRLPPCTKCHGNEFKK